MKKISVLNRKSRDITETWLQESLLHWLTLWFVEIPTITVNFNERLFSCEALAQEDAVYQIGAGHVVFYNETKVLDVLAHRALSSVNPEHVDRDLFEQLKEKIFCSLLRGLIGEQYQYEKLLDSPPFCPAVSVQISFVGTQMKMAVGIEALDILGKLSLSKSTTKLKERAQVIDQSQVTINAALPGVELSLKELLSLKPGDLIKLPHALDSPVLLKTEDNNIDVNAFLVQHRTKKALILDK